MTTTKRFEGPRLKLQRAKHHIEDFVSRAEKFYRESKSKLFIRDDPYTGMRAVCVDVDTTVPSEFQLIIGDAIHNLRSALDHLTWDLVSPLNPERPGDVQFPFCRKAESFEGALTHRQIKLAGEEIAQKFRDLKPYPGGDDILYALHQLDIADKHQLVLTVRSRIAFDYINVRDEIEGSAPKGLIIENTAFTNVEKDNRIAAWPYKPGTPLNTSGPNHGKPINIVVQIMFRTGQPLGGENVASNLREMAMIVERAIKSFF